MRPINIVRAKFVHNSKSWHETAKDYIIPEAEVDCNKIRYELALALYWENALKQARPSDDLDQMLLRTRCFNDALQKIGESIFKSAAANGLNLTNVGEE
jgi:hypothetical protein